ncbi:ribosome biogenesis GTP-binding protein YihA/YsxC [Spiroplasma endosymbiont of Agriotes lineatus]|uniref:ribosome biogenesis GTP-binding protein YihA/YsxC n=1 Tax=Spiroplasma endosymbiont of Agriotes lineatus TaxID=3077930 RepID=UPI0030D1DC0C
MKITKSVFFKGAINKKQWIDDEISEVLLLGRSNVGKSTFINSLCNNKQLAKVSSSPGKTQMLNFFAINDNEFRFVDCPGYGFTKISKSIKKEFVKMMDTYLLSRKNLKLAILLLDLRRIPNNDDLLMFSFLQARNINILIVATKLDKLKKNDIRKQEKIIKETLLIINDIDIIKTSSISKVGYDAVLEKITEYI